MDWTPTISDRQGPLYLRIVSALADDIESGRLHPGQSLPTHRALALALGVDLTTVTRAYTEARARGLTDARVGRGTFVRSVLAAGHRSPASPGIDLSMNLPPQPPEADLDGRVAKTLAEIRADTGLGPYLTYQQPGGTAAERRTAADWFEPLVPGIQPDRLILSPGTQPALLCLLMALTSPGDSVLTETLTYPGLKAAAAAVGVKLIGVDMDGCGLKPSALEEACRRHAARAIYLMPTLHNPTTATMPPARRAEIAEIIRRHSLVLIEDDPYCFFLAPGVAPLATLIPERTYLAASLSKCLAPGLRTSLLVVPDGAATQRITGLLRAVLQMPAPLTTAVVTRWMRDGTADAVIAAIRSESSARQTLARDALAGHRMSAHPNGLHVWLELPDAWSGARFAAHLHNRGLAVVTGEAFATSGDAPACVRIALGAARTRAQLAKALDILREALGSQSHEGFVV